MKCFLRSCPESAVSVEGMGPPNSYRTSGGFVEHMAGLFASVDVKIDGNMVTMYLNLNASIL